MYSDVLYSTKELTIHPFSASSSYVSDSKMALRTKRRLTQKAADNKVVEKKRTRLQKVSNFLSSNADVTSKWTIPYNKRVYIPQQSHSLQQLQSLPLQQIQLQQHQQLQQRHKQEQEKDDEQVK